MAGWRAPPGTRPIDLATLTERMNLWAILARRHLVSEKSHGTRGRGNGQIIGPPRRPGGGKVLARPLGSGGLAADERPGKQPWGAGQAAILREMCNSYFKGLTVRKPWP